MGKYKNTIKAMRKMAIKSKKNKQKKSFIRRIFLFFFISGVFLSCFVVAIFLYFSQDLPDFNKLKNEVRSPAITIVDKENNVIATYGDLYGEVLNTEQLPHYVYNAFVAIEDKRFFKHHGIDPLGIIRAIYSNYLRGGVAQGGSTITQQLAKNILILEGKIKYNNKSIARKIREVIIALWLESKFNKREIMTMYLNRSYFGSGTYGIDAASKKFFNKSARHLTLFESAILAGSLQSPSRYNIISNKYSTFNRAQVVLKCMEEQGMLQDYQRVYQDGVCQFEEDSLIRDKTTHNIMYFADYAYKQAKNILGTINEDIVIVTTINRDAQDALEMAVEHYYKQKSGSMKFKQVAAASYDRHGALLAMVGGIDYLKSQFNRAYQAKRLIGSICKIFVYGAALNSGYKFDDMISDEPPQFDGWSPANYKWDSKGEISLLEGFRYSVNAVSIRLTQDIGISKVVSFAKLFGIDMNKHDLTVALGTTDSNICDILAAYTSFMDGMKVKPYAVSEIKRASDGGILYQRGERVHHRIIDDELLQSCRTLLRDVIANGTGYLFNTNKYTYGKTGTNSGCDAWFFGFYDPPASPDCGFSVGVWVGNDDINDHMSAASLGGNVPTLIARMFTGSMIASYAKRGFSKILNEISHEEDVRRNL